MTVNSRREPTMADTGSQTGLHAGRGVVAVSAYPWRVEVIDRTDGAQIEAREGERLADPGWSTFWDSATERLIYDPEIAEGAPNFRPAGEPDELRDVFDSNMPRVSGCMYFAIPGEQPIHVSDEEARHFLAWLSEQRA